MRSITKGAEPVSLTTHRQRPHSNYDNYNDKDALREALVREQRGLCCYCMGRIYNDRASVKIEHWQCQSRYSCEQLNYRNLLAACLGGDGQPNRFQHCDTKKGDLDLVWNPANPAHRIEDRVRYDPDGCIRSNNPKFDIELCRVLNLNLPILKNNRRGIRDAILDWWKIEAARIRGPVSRARLQRERNRQLPPTGRLNPYCQVAVWWLDQRLQRMAA